MKMQDLAKHPNAQHRMIDLLVIVGA